MPHFGDCKAALRHAPLMLETALVRSIAAVHSQETLVCSDTWMCVQGDACLLIATHAHARLHHISAGDGMIICMRLFCAGKKGSNGEVLGIASSDDKSGNALHVSVSFSTLDISLVDHIPEELVAVTIQGLSFGMAFGIGPEGTFQRMQLSVQKLQIDDQLSASRYSTHGLHALLQSCLA